MALTRQLGHREPRVIMKQSPAHEAISGLKDWRLLLSGWCLSCRKKNLCYLQKDKYITITISRGLNKRSYLGILPLGLNKRMQYTSWECTWLHSATQALCPITLSVPSVLLDYYYPPPHLPHTHTHTYSHTHSYSYFLFHQTWAGQSLHQTAFKITSKSSFIFLFLWNPLAWL